MSPARHLEPRDQNEHEHPAADPLQGAERARATHAHQERQINTPEDEEDLDAVRPDPLDRPDGWSMVHG